MDQIQDRNQVHMYQLYTLVEFPDFVKTASQLTEAEARELPVGAFACPNERTFPIDSKADTWLSWAYFCKTAADIPAATRESISSKLIEAATFWGITELPKPECFEKKAAAPRLQIRYPLNPAGDRVVDVNTPRDMLKVAADCMDYNKYVWETRRSVARQVLAAPIEYRREIPGYTLDALYKTAAYGVGPLSAAKQAIKLRKAASQWYHPKVREGLDELETLLDHSAVHGLLGAEILDKTASVLDAVDHFTGCVARYGGTFQVPEQSLFAITAKDMADFEANSLRLSDGSYIPKEAALNDTSRFFLQSALGIPDKGAAEVPKQLRELPERKTRLFVEYLRNTEQI